MAKKCAWPGCNETDDGEEPFFPLDRDGEPRLCEKCLSWLLLSVGPYIQGDEFTDWIRNIIGPTRH
jgi:hypothetical protein